MTLSASGARIQGDDYQHLFAWYQALRTLKPDDDVSGIAIEAEDAGNVDDVVVRHRSGADEHYQVKYSVTASRPIDRMWWITTKTKGGMSPLQRFWESWLMLGRSGSLPHLALYTNRPLDISDPLLVLRDGRTGCLGPRLRLEKPGSKAGKARQEWAAHLGASEDDLLEMLEHLELRTDQAPWSGLCSAASDRMAAVGLQSDDQAVEQGVSAIRSWVAEGVREVGREKIAAEVASRGLEGAERRATLCVQAIDRDGWAASATVSLDWVDLYVGATPQERRQLSDPAHWNERLLPDLKAAEQNIRGLGFHRVLVRGYMRLPAWFATGFAFSDVRCNQVACVQRGERWGSETEPRECGLDIAFQPIHIGIGEELAIGLSVTNDLSDDVLAFAREARLPARNLVHIRATPVPSKTAIPDAATAMGWALAVREVVRKQARETGARKVHLFMSGPAGAALFLGHIWNRVPPTLIYEDLNPGYSPAFLIQ